MSAWARLRLGWMNKKTTKLSLKQWVLHFLLNNLVVARILREAHSVVGLCDPKNVLVWILGFLPGGL